MKKFLKPYRHLTALLAIVMLAVSGVLLHILSLPMAGAIVACYQLLQIAMSKKQCSALYIAALSEEQIKEFENILGSFKGYGGMFKELDTLAKSEGGFAAIRKLPELLSAEGKRVDEIQKEMNKLRKTLSTAQHATGVKWVGNVPFVTDDCARALSSVLVLEAHKLGENAMRQLNREARTHESLLTQAREFLGIGQKAGGALSPTDIPMPTIYMPQIIELVFKYGQARQFATVFPLGAGTVKLPQLKAGEDDFNFLGAGTGGISQAISQKEVTAQLVTFTANKAGGLIRIPTELEEDTFVALGQFLARYVARQFAKLEDKTLFLADGSGTYANITGIASYCAANGGTYLQTLAAGKTKPTDATINDFRAMRALVNPAILANMAANGQTAAAYYLNPTLEALLVTFNTINNPYIYVRGTGTAPATLDGFPIRWIGVSQSYSTKAAPAANLAFFGDLSYWYLGERGAPRVEVSREVFFATDELAMRALERIDVEAMAVDAMSTLQTAAQ